MALTRDFREMVVACAERDPEFRRALLETGIEMLLTGDPEDAEIGRESIRTYIGELQKAEGVRLGVTTARAG